MNIPLIRSALEAAIPFLESSAQTDAVYGFFHGGDPRDFSPDPEASTEEEQAAHRAACEAFTEDKPLPGCCEHVRDEDGKTAMIITRSTFGMGINQYADEDAAEALRMLREALQDLDQPEERQSKCACGHPDNFNCGVEAGA